jgi:hypothetical protein
MNTWTRQSRRFEFEKPCQRPEDIDFTQLHSGKPALDLRYLSRPHQSISDRYT